MVKKALLEAGREDLIGNSERCIIKPKIEKTKANHNSKTKIINKKNLNSNKQLSRKQNKKKR